MSSPSLASHSPIRFWWMTYSSASSNVLHWLCSASSRIFLLLIPFMNLLSIFSSLYFLWFRPMFISVMFSSSSISRARRAYSGSSSFGFCAKARTSSFILEVGVSFLHFSSSMSIRSSQSYMALISCMSSHPLGVTLSLMR